MSKHSSARRKVSDRDGSPAAGRKCANGSAANRKLSSVGHPFLWPLTVSFDLLGLILSSLDFLKNGKREPPILPPSENGAWQVSSPPSVDGFPIFSSSFFVERGKKNERN